MYVKNYVCELIFKISPKWKILTLSDLTWPQIQKKKKIIMLSQKDDLTACVLYKQGLLCGTDLMDKSLQILVPESTMRKCDTSGLHEDLSILWLIPTTYDTSINSLIKIKK